MVLNGKTAPEGERNATVAQSRTGLGMPPMKNYGSRPELLRHRVDIASLGLRLKS